MQTPGPGPTSPTDGRLQHGGPRPRPHPPAGGHQPQDDHSSTACLVRAQPTPQQQLRDPHRRPPLNPALPTSRSALGRLGPLSQQPWNPSSPLPAGQYHLHGTSVSSVSSARSSPLTTAPEPALGHLEPTASHVGTDPTYQRANSRSKDPAPEPGSVSGLALTPRPARPCQPEAAASSPGRAWQPDWTGDLPHPPCRPP